MTTNLIILFINGSYLKNKEQGGQGFKEAFDAQIVIWELQLKDALLSQ